MKKNNNPKLIIFFSKLSIGGMERSLVELIRNSNLKKNYEVTLYVGYVLEKSYLDELNKLINVKVIWPYKWNIIGKIYSYIKMNIDGLFLKNKYDVSICYSHHHQILGKLTRLASCNSICFIHGDLSKSRSKEELIKLDKKLQFLAFNKVVCVSEEARKSFLIAYPNYQKEVYVINNYINGDNILKDSKEKVDDYPFKGITFINITRHEEKTKQVSFIIEATKKLISEGYKFNVLLLGSGPDDKLYQEMINKYNLNNITLLGSRTNPYKYLKKADALVFTSRYEGYGLVLDEARVLEIPIITTIVGDAKKIIDAGYGILCDNNNLGVYKGMKKFLDEGFVTKKFNYQEFNKIITEKIDKVVSNE